MSDRFERIASRVASSILAVSVGDMFENDAIRVQRWMSSLRVWDLTNAGKRGKRVDVIAMYNLDFAPDATHLIKALGNDLEKARSFRQAKRMMEDALVEIESVGGDTHRQVNIAEDTERGVDVAPAGFKPVKINGKKVYIEADYKSFVVRDKEDQYNLPTCIPAVRGGKADIKVFYRWVMDNENQLRNMSYSEVTSGMRKAGIRYHSYCAMD